MHKKTYASTRLGATLVAGLVLAAVMASASAYADADRNSFGGQRGNTGTNFGHGSSWSFQPCNSCHLPGSQSLFGGNVRGYGDGAYVSPFGSGAVGNVAPPNGGKM